MSEAIFTSGEWASDLRMAAHLGHRWYDEVAITEDWTFTVGMANAWIEAHNCSARVCDVQVQENGEALWLIV